MKRPTIFAFCLLMLVVAISADDNSKRKTLQNCVCDQLLDDNDSAAPKFKLNDDQVGQLQVLINDEINKASLVDVNDEKQQRIIKHLETVAVTSLPSVPTEILHEILFKLKATAGHCVNDLNAPPK